MKNFLRNALMLTGVAALFVATALPVEAARTALVIVTTGKTKPVVSAP